ncbi:MAG TPA: LLM class flavin-dependent oxidoreductase, partial [Acidimicrobiales bacterium]
MGDVTLGVLPVFKQGYITNPAHTRAFVQMLEAEGVESVWAVEHVVVARDYEPRYSYSPSGRMPGAPDTEMPDPLEWLSFVAACTERLRLGTAVLVLTLHQPAIVAKRVATL